VRLQRFGLAILEHVPTARDLSYRALFVYRDPESGCITI
jgi:hypothetical protein